jgi:rSAM/selenodomain-associated transferase 2
MRAPISVVIPTLNAATCLPHCLRGLAEGLQAGLIRELVISDGGSEDDTLHIAEAAGAHVVSGAACRGEQVRRGIAASHGDWLLVLHADTRLQQGWHENVHTALMTQGAYHFRLAFDVDGFLPAWVAGWANLRSGVLGLPYGDQGLLIDRATLDAAGGYPALPLMEDVALARRLRLRELKVTATTSAEKYTRQGWLRRGARNLTLLARYYAGTDPEVLARAYRR